MAAKSASSGKEKLIEEEEEVLQAVILADSFNKRFRPLTTRKPRCLLPICNAPLLDWTFESLALAGVQEVFVICRSHAELVKDAIKDSKWSKPGSGMKIVPIMTAKETFSPGDAMRDIYTRGLVTSDFVLVMGDLVSNIRIDEVVRVHKERRRTNKDAIMTMVVKESGERHRTRPTGESSVFVLDPETSECLHYEHVQGHPKKKDVKIPREIFAAHPELDIRNDLLDCSIDVCSVEVPSLFQDNFDYLDIRRDFVHGILTSDILMKNIYCYVAEEGYAARVQDTRSYESISKDILSRWTFPLVPDDNHPGGHIYEHTRGNRYIAKDNTVVLARTCNIGTNTLIGSSTTVGDNVSINASVIGQKCRIGAGSIIRNSYLFEGAVIGENCTIERSIIGAGVQIKDNSQVAKGCLIADGVIVGPNADIKPFERLSVRRNEADIEADEDDDDSDIEEVENNQDEKQLVSLGKDTNAIVWPRGPSADEDEDDEGPETFKNQKFMRLGETVSDLGLSDDEDLSSESESESDSDDSDNEHQDLDSISGLSEASLQLKPLDSGMGGLMADKEFQAEVKQSLDRAFDEGHSTENAAVELKTLRMASNVPLTRVKEAVMDAIVERIPLIENDPAVQRKEISQLVGRWGQLINLIGGIDPVETIAILQAHCASSARMSLFGQILAALYQEDIVEEDDIRAWHRDPASKYVGDIPSHADKAGAGEKMTAIERENANKCWTIGSAMIQQFDAQASDSDEDSDEDSSEDEKPKPSAKSSAAQKKPVDSGDSASGSGSDSDTEEEKPTPKIAPAVPKFVADKSAEGSDKSEDSSDAGSDSEKEETKVTVVASSSKSTPIPPPSVSSSDDESESDADAEQEIKPATPTNEKTETKSAESTDDSESEAESAKKSAHVARDRAATITPSTVAASAESSSAESTDDESEKETGEDSKPTAELPASTSEASASVSTAATTPTAEVPAPPLAAATTPITTTRDRAATVTPLNSTVPTLSAPSAAPVSAESSETSDSSESEAESVPASKPAASSAPKASSSAPAPAPPASASTTEDESDSNNASSSSEGDSFVKVTNTNPVISLPSGSDLTSSLSSASGSSMLTPVPDSTGTDSTASDSDSDALSAARKQGKAKAKSSPGATLQAPTPKKAQTFGQAAAGAAASVASAILGRLSPSRSLSGSTPAAPAPVGAASTSSAAAAPAEPTAVPVASAVPGSGGSSATSLTLAATRTAPPVIESSGDEADDGDAEGSTDDGMSDAVSASEGSAAPSANASDNEDEDEDDAADANANAKASVDTGKGKGKAGELRD